MIANLDNEVFFKKAFTDTFVLKHFVKDVLEMDLDFDKVETEKSFDPRIGNIDFKYDIFAESTDKRVIIEIQKVDYDYNFDRFLHYFLMAIAELQRSSKNYGIEKTVYAVIFITAPYKINQKTGIPIKDELLISILNPKNIKGDELNIYGHSLVFLNPNYKNAETPARIRDWLDLVYESMHNPEKPSINQNNDGIKRASEILDFEHISPSEWEQSKIREGRKMVQLMAKEEGVEEGKIIGREEGINIGVEKERERSEKEKEDAIRKAIAKRKLSLEEIAEVFGVSVEFVKHLPKGVD